jgi:flagellar secretion chaperone FliS
MNDYSAVSAYQQSAARGASPVGLVVALYDTILRDFRRALAGLDSGMVESRVFELNHALTVIAHLRDVLDHQRGGQAAAQLLRFYDLTHAMILETNVGGSRSTLMKLIDLYANLRQAWEQAERQIASSDSAAPPLPSTGLRSLETSAIQVSGPAPTSAEAPLVSSGRWSA